MNPLLITLISLIHPISSNSSIDNLFTDYKPLYYSELTTSIITNPCQTDQSILIRNHSIYSTFHRQWKRLCISKKFFPTEGSFIVHSVTYLNNELILIINGNLFQTQEMIVSASTDQDIIYRLRRYSNLPILANQIDYAFTIVCCACVQTKKFRSISQTLNDYVILANRSGYAMLFNMKSATVMYDFGNLFQLQTICQSNPCTIQYLGLVHFQSILICVVEYQPGKSIIYHQSFLELNSTHQKSTYINYTGDTLHIAPSAIPNSYFFWDDRTVYYTPNAGQILSKVLSNGCQIDYLTDLTEDQLKIYFNNLAIPYDNLSLITKDIYCLNLSIDYVFISKQEFFIFTKTNQWFYGRESFFPSMIHVESSCIRNQSLPAIDPECFTNQSYPCSSFVQSSCPYTRFEPLFDINQIYVLEKAQQQTWKFLLETYRDLPVMISSTKSSVFNYSIVYQSNRLKNGIIQTIGSISVSTTNQTRTDQLGSSMLSLRLGLLQYGYSCQQMPSLFKSKHHVRRRVNYALKSIRQKKTFPGKFDVYIARTNEFEDWNHTRYTTDIEWLRKTLPTNILRQFSPVYIKRKQPDSILLNYHYCLNHTCQLLPDTQLDLFLIYVIPLDKAHEDYAHYLINRTDDCLPLNRLIYRLWIKWIMNSKSHHPQLQMPYERRTFYRTLLNLLSISRDSCLFFNGSKPIEINSTINRASDDYLKFILHIIALDNRFSFCELETFVLIEIEPLHELENSYRGFIFIITLFLLIFFFILSIHLYTYYKKQQRNQYLKYHRLNQIDAGQFHQWYDIARYLNENKNTENYFSIQNSLSNLESTASLTKRLLESHHNN